MGFKVDYTLKFFINRSKLLAIWYDVRTYLETSIK